jgi:D-alanyl-D-alanine carboxypeptidase
MGLTRDGPRVWAATDVLALMGDTLFSPGAGWRYASTGFVAAGVVLEAVTGQTLAEAFRERFFTPLAMTRTMYAGSEPVAPPLAAPPLVALLSAAGPAGAVITTAEDLVTWTYALGSGALLAPAAQEALTTFVDRPDGHRYGLGLLRIELDGMVLLGHRGNTATFSAATWYAPVLDLTITVLTDKPGVPVTGFVRAILSRYSGVLPRSR